MSTVVCQIEACLNSRPLVPLNSTSDETNAHSRSFLGRSPTNCYSRWNKLRSTSLNAVAMEFVSEPDESTMEEMVARVCG